MHQLLYFTNTVSFAFYERNDNHLQIQVMTLGSFSGDAKADKRVL